MDATLIGTKIGPLHRVVFIHLLETTSAVFDFIQIKQLTQVMRRRNKTKERLQNTDHNPDICLYTNEEESLQFCTNSHLGREWGNIFTIRTTT